jgi:hypothetical protein
MENNYNGRILFNFLIKINFIIKFNLVINFNGITIWFTLVSDDLAI